MNDTSKALITAYNDLFSATKTPPAISVEQTGEHTYALTLKAAPDALKRAYAKLVPEPGVFNGPTLADHHIGQTLVESIAGDGENQTLTITHVLHPLR